MKKLLSVILRFIGVVFMWSILRVKMNVQMKDGDGFSMTANYRVRLYSPVCWLIAIVALPYYILFGGVVKWVREMIEFAGIDKQEQFDGEFRPDCPKWKKLYALREVVYLGF